MTRHDLLAVVQRLYADMGDNDWQLSQRIGISNKTVKRWRTASVEDFNPTADNVLRIAQTAALDPFDALDAVDLRDLADFLRRAGRALTGAVTVPGEDPLKPLTPEEGFFIGHVRKLQETAPHEASALIAYVQARIQTLDRLHANSGARHSSDPPRRRRR